MFFNTKTISIKRDSHEYKKLTTLIEWLGGKKTSIEFIGRKFNFY